MILTLTTTSTFQTWCNNEKYWTLNETNCTPGGVTDSPSEDDFKTWANNDYPIKDIEKLLETFSLSFIG